MLAGACETEKRKQIKCSQKSVKGDIPVKEKMLKEVCENNTNKRFIEVCENNTNKKKWGGVK